MTTTTTEKPLTAKQILAAKRLEVKTMAKSLKDQKAQAQEQEKQESEKLLTDLAGLQNLSVVCGDNDEHTLTLREALIDGQKVQIPVTIEGETKMRDHTVFMDAPRRKSLASAIVRIQKILANQEIRPKVKATEGENVEGERAAA